MVELMTVYDAFLAKVNEDDWAHCYSEDDLKWFIQDWRSFLNASIVYFKFPRCGLDIDEEKQCFKDESFSNEEVQVLATYMKWEWLKRTIDSWENIKTQYDESDFSQAKLLSTFIELRKQIQTEAEELQAIYYRSVAKRPFHYRNLAGKHNRWRR